MNGFKVVVAESHPILIQGIQDWLDKNELFSSVTISSDWEAIQQMIGADTNIILILTHTWINNNPGIPLFMKFFSENQFKVLCFVDKSTSDHISELYDCGIQCLITDSDPEDEFLFGLKALMNGKRHISSDLLQSFNKFPFSLNGNSARHINLTKREAEIVHFICQGYTNKEIAGKLFISKRTVDGYRETILSKFGARNTAQLMSKIIDGQNTLISLRCKVCQPDGF